MSIDSGTLGCLFYFGKEAIMKKNRRIVMPLLVFILVIGGWELYVRAFDISHYILPSP